MQITTEAAIFRQAEAIQLTFCNVSFSEVCTQFPSNCLACYLSVIKTILSSDRGTSQHFAQVIIKSRHDLKRSHHSASMPCPSQAGVL